MERLTFDEIKKRHPDEWVLLAEPETESGLSIKSGVLVAHNPKRGEIYRKQLHLKGDYAILFTGDIAKNKIFVL